MNDSSNKWKKVEEKIRNAQAICIYGAGVVAYGIYCTIKEVCGIKPAAFIVSECDEKYRIEDIPVHLLSQQREVCKNALVIVATPEIYHNEIKVELDKLEIENVIWVDSHVEYLFMCEYYKKHPEFPLLDINSLEVEQTGDDSSKHFQVYMAKCHVDKPLKKEVITPEWVYPIQVGRVLTEKKIEDICDNTGDNISEKNKNYSELTATYWVWKNVKSQYKGICHYRRQLVLSKADLSWIKEMDVDVVLPLPFVCYPNAKGQYGRYISEDDQKILFGALQEVSPEYAKAAEELLKRPYLYNYNMLIAKEAVFNDYCEWLFPILFRAEEMRKEQKGDLEDRFAGYFGEVLTAVYFLKNRDSLKIVHTKRIWYV